MSITTRVVWRAVVVMLAVLAAVALLTVQLVRVAGRSEIDRLLEDETAVLARTLGEQWTDGAGLDGELSRPEIERGARNALVLHPSGPRHVSVIRLDGTRLHSEGGPPELATLIRGSDAPQPVPGKLDSVETSVGDVRALDLTVLGADGAPLAVVSVYASLEASEATADAVLRRSMIAAAIGLAVGAGALVYAVSRALRPVRDVATATAAIGPDDLGARVPTPGTADEIEAIAVEINDLLERIDDADEQRMTELAAVSHELRTPLAVARGHLDVFERELDDLAASRRTAATIGHELDRLTRLLDDLLTVARSDEPIQVEHHPVFLPDLYDSLRHSIAGLDGGSQVVVGTPPPTVILGDQLRLEQCLINLARNAVDHNPPGTEVTISATTDSSNVRLVVADTGTGIAPDVAERAFEPFITTRTHHPANGAGLGLAVVHDLIQAQGGTIELASSATGTDVTITIPQATSETEPAP